MQCDRRLLAKLRTLDKNVLREKLSRWLTQSEIDALAAQAGRIVNFFDKESRLRVREQYSTTFQGADRPAVQDCSGRKRGQRLRALHCRLISSDFLVQEAPRLSKPFSVYRFG